MSILDKIVRAKKLEIADLKGRIPINELERSTYFSGTTRSLVKRLSSVNEPGIIAEFKRKSPSKGLINGQANVLDVVSGYERAGAAAASVLTDQTFFGGSSEDIMECRKAVGLPILRKEFIIDEYQIIEAKSIGADVLLLIAAVLEPQEIKRFTALAHSIGLEVLLEVHNENELVDNLDSGVDLVGVNNRDLKTFVVDVNTSKRLSTLIPDHFIKISESGLSAPEMLIELMDYGFAGFLMGESFMKHTKPETACLEFINKLKLLVKS